MAELTTKAVGADEYSLRDPASGTTVRFDDAFPHVIALAGDLIGMFWLE